MKTIFYLLLISTSLQLSAQVAEIESHMLVVRKGSGSGANTAFVNDSVNYLQSLEKLRGYYSDSTASVRKEAYYLTRRIGERTHNAKLRKQITLSLSQGCLDKDPAVAMDAAESLSKFRFSDFNEEAKDNVRKTIVTPNYSFSIMVRLAGFLKLTDQQSAIKNLISLGKVKDLAQWNARMALARMGDKEQISFCVNKLKSVPLSSRSLETVVPDLVYIRQKESMESIFQIINSDTKTCGSSNPDNPVSIPCAYRALKYLSFVVKDYPIKPDKYGDVEIVDYEKALKDVREWLKNKNGKVEWGNEVY